MNLHPQTPVWECKTNLEQLLENTYHGINTNPAEQNILKLFFSPFFILLLKSQLGNGLKSPGQEQWIIAGPHWYELLCSTRKRIYMHFHKTLNTSHHARPAGELLILKTLLLVPTDHYLVKFMYTEQHVNTETRYGRVPWNTGKRTKHKPAFFVPSRLLLQQSSQSVVNKIPGSGLLWLKTIWYKS